MSAKRKPPASSGYAWALWNPWSGLNVNSVRRTPSQAIDAVWSREYWPKARREGYRVVRVHIDAIYFRSTKAQLKRVPK